MSTTAEADWVVEDGEEVYTPPPCWVFEAIRVGFMSFSAAPSVGQPLFGLISTPCDSSFAGLVTLGAQLRLLVSTTAFPRTVDPVRYFQFLWDQADGTGLRCRTEGQRVYELDAESRRVRTGLELAVRQRGLGRDRRLVFAETSCLNWEPVDCAQSGSAAGGFDSLRPPEEAGVLRGLSLDTEPIPDDRLRFNYPEVVLVGPTGGLPAFRYVYEDRFQLGTGLDDTRFSLSQLLRLRGTPDVGTCAWRGVHINPLSRSADADARDAARRARLVIFHGAEPFLRLGDHFRKCDRILVASRGVSNGVLESLCSKLYQDRRDSGDVEEGGASWLHPSLHMIQGFRYWRRRKGVAL